MNIDLENVFYRISTQFLVPFSIIYLKTYSYFLISQLFGGIIDFRRN